MTGRSYDSETYFDYATIKYSQDPVIIIENLIEEIEDMDLPRGTENNLVFKLNDAIILIEKENFNGAKQKLGDFIDYIKAQRGKKIPEEQTDYLIWYAEGIIENIED